MDVKRFADMKKLTAAAAKLRIKKKEKVHSEKEAKAKESFTTPEADKQREQDKLRQTSQSLSSSKKGLPHHIVAATRVTLPERRWTLTDLLHNLGVFVQNHCTHLHTVPSASEVAMWVRCADRALQLNGWTVNCFLLESHVVFTFLLLQEAFERFPVRTLADVKELVLMCLYTSYTYNANEISYPLRPFLVKQDKAAFWDKCLTLSLKCSGKMLQLNRDVKYYASTLSTLKRVTSL